MADSNRVSLIYVLESTYGVTPTNSTGWKTLRFRGENLKPTYTGKQSEEIRADRNRGNVSTVAASVGGTVDVELSATSYDDVFEAVLGGTWSSNVLKVGTVKRSFSVQKAFNDLATGNKFDVYSGMRFGQFDLSLPYGDLSSGQITMAGSGVVDNAAGLVGTGTVAAATTTRVLSATSDITSVQVNSVESALAFKSVSLKLGAQLREKDAIKYLYAFDQGYGSAMIELNAECYFDSRTLEDLVRSGAAFQMSFTISDGTNSYIFNLPRAYRTQRDGINAQKLDDDVMQSITIVGAYDPTTASSVVITRAP